MRRGTLPLLFFIILLAVGASFVVFWPNQESRGNKPLYGINNPFTITEGLDLQGGLRVLLAPKDPKDPTATTENMQTTRNVIESRVNGLGLKEPSIRLITTNSNPAIAVDLPHFNGNEEDAVNTLLRTGKLEFWLTGTTTLPQNQAFDPSQYTQDNPGGKPWFTGRDLDPSALQVGQDPQTNAYLIEFKMQGDAINKFASFTQTNVQKAMTVTLDRSVITSATIQSAITGNGQITGRFTQKSAQDIVNNLKYGALPVTLTKISEETISPTLGDEAIRKSLLAGAIGIGIVMLFMLLYYRLPGLLADIALVLYSILTFAIFKLLGVTITLAGIAGFILSIGMAVDANVLIFERIKEELRAGRTLAAAIDMGWKRAWPSIRDSNSSTLITCAVLYGFGSNFGATIIVGFAITLFLGVIVSMFTAIVVTRTLLNLLVPTGVINHPALFGLSADAIAKPKPAVGLARRDRAGSAV